MGGEKMFESNRSLRNSYVVFVWNEWRKGGGTVHLSLPILFSSTSPLQPPPHLRSVSPRTQSYPSHFSALSLATCPPTTAACPHAVLQCTVSLHARTSYRDHYQTSSFSLHLCLCDGVRVASPEPLMYAIFTESASYCNSRNLLFIGTRVDI